MQFKQFPGDVPHCSTVSVGAEIASQDTTGDLSIIKEPQVGLLFLGECLFIADA